MSAQKKQSQEVGQVIKQRRDKAKQLEEKGLELYPNEYKKDTDIAHLLKKFSKYSAQELKKLDSRYSLAGRIMSIRSFGKATFLHLQDKSEKIQIFAQKDTLGAESYKIFKKYDIGDIIGVKGVLFRTKTEELTLNAEELKLLSKSLRPFPEKYHGLKDIEARYRRRYVDLTVNPQTKKIFQTRTNIIRLLRNYFDEKGFQEVETPMMQPIPGGATAKPFETYHIALDMTLYLRIAPELYLKRLLVGGLEKVYEINRNFRNEGISTQHNPEFTMLEFYWAYADFYALMDFTEQLFAQLAETILGHKEITYQGQSINLTPPWNRISFFEALEKIGGLKQEEYRERSLASALVQKLGENVQPKESLGKIQAKLFDILVEPKLIQPHFVYHYPTDISPLSRKNQDNPDLTDRFELFISGREMANAFSELNDPRDQKQRFEEQVRAKSEGDEESHYMDEDYIIALEYGMPPAAGEGIGIDRLVMLFTDSASIREVILFPLLKPETTIE